jgi:Transposase IS116/IS110/IS902 family
MGDRTRFEPPRALMQFLGLIPSEYASGAQRRQGAMTTAGNPQARRVLVEGAWAYRSPAKVSRHVPRRLETQPKVIQDIRWKAQVRLCKRYRRLVARGKHANVVTVAIARELPASCGPLPRRSHASRTIKTALDDTQDSGPCNSERFHGASAETQPRCGVILGGVRRLGQDTRAESEAGTRRRQVRWYPTHGYQ